MCLAKALQMSHCFFLVSAFLSVWHPESHSYPPTSQPPNIAQGMGNYAKKCVFKTERRTVCCSRNAGLSSDFYWTSNLIFIDVGWQITCFILSLCLSVSLCRCLSVSVCLSLSLSHFVLR